MPSEGRGQDRCLKAEGRGRDDDVLPQGRGQDPCLKREKRGRGGGTKLLVNDELKFIARLSFLWLSSVDLMMVQPGTIVCVCVSIRTVCGVNGGPGTCFSECGAGE